MPAYFLFDNVEVLDVKILGQYKEAVALVVQAHGGRYVSIGGPVERMEGYWSPAFPVLIEFPDLESARAWYRSDAYRPLKALRMQAVRCNAVLIGGL